MCGEVISKGMGSWNTQEILLVKKVIFKVNPEVPKMRIVVFNISTIM